MTTAPSPRHPPQPVETIPGDPGCGLLLLCDHASNAVPPDLDSLGVAAPHFERHIAYDIGAASVTRRSPGASGRRRSSPPSRA